MRSFHPGGMQNCGARQRLAPGPEMRPYGLQNASGGQSGDAGAGITAEAASRRKCTASNCSASASWHETFAVRSPKFTSVSPYSIASPRSEPQSHRPFGKQRPIKELAASNSRFVQQSRGPASRCARSYGQNLTDGARNTAATCARELCPSGRTDEKAPPRHGLSQSP